MQLASHYSPMTRALKLLVVEDHPVYLEGLSFILKRLSSDVELECVHGTHEAQAVLNEKQDYDLILLDLTLPDGGGLSILNYLAQNNVFIPAVVLSGSEEFRDVKLSLSAGASGFISKASGSDEILNAIKQVMDGDRYLPEFYLRVESYETALSRPELTPRQLEVLQLLCEGLPNKRICQRLNLTEHTVKSHLKSLFSVLEVHNRTECARVATELALL